MAQLSPVSPAPRHVLVESPLAGHFPQGSADFTVDDRARHYKRDAIICISFHVVLLVIHVALFGVYSHHYERGVTFPISPFTSNWLPFIVTTILQVIGTVSVAVLTNALGLLTRER